MECAVIHSRTSIYCCAQIFFAPGIAWGSFCVWSRSGFKAAVGSGTGTVGGMRTSDCVSVLSFALAQPI